MLKKGDGLRDPTVWNRETTHLGTFILFIENKKKKNSTIDMETDCVDSRHYSKLGKNAGVSRLSHFLKISEVWWPKERELTF